VSGHSRWSMIRELIWRHSTEKLVSDEWMLQQLDGYILALEDVLGDIERSAYGVGWSAEYVDGYGSALENLKSDIEESLASARRTRDMIREKLDRG